MKNLKGYFSNLWVINSPVIVYRVVNGFFRALILRKSTLKIVELFPSMACNLECKMCSVEKYKQSNREVLSIGDYEILAKDAAKMGAIAVTILGGEPLLANNLEQIIKTFKKHHFYIHTVTNAVLADEKKMIELKKWGLNSICFSLDSFNEKENDEIRGDGHYKKVMGLIDIAKKIGFEVSLSPVFFPGSLEKGIEVVKFCQKNKIGAAGAQVAPIGGWEGGEILSAEENNKLRALLKEFPRLTFDWALSYFLRMQCPAGREKIAITTFGDVVGCSINPISFGNVKKESLQKIWNRMGKFSQFKKRAPVCLSAEDKLYIDEYIKPIYKFKRYPVEYSEHPTIEKELNNLA